MTRITLFTAGSQGDVQPCLLLADALRLAGFDVLLAAPANVADQARRLGVPFHPLRADVQAIMSGETGRDYMESGGANPIRAALSMRRMIGPIATRMAEDALEACRHADALICLAVFAPLGRTLAEICGLPLIYVEPTPLLPTGAFPAAGWPVQRDLGAWPNRVSGRAMLWLIWQWYGPFVNAFRRHHGLRPLRGGDFQRALATTPLLGAYSPALIPRPVDWPDRAHVTGYWFQDNGAGWAPPAALERFLEVGEPPIYVGFGSMAGRHPERLGTLVLDAVARCGCRAVLATGWGGLEPANAPRGVFVLDRAPHNWLFPRMAAVVHHGGAGTTAEGLRAGRPTAIVPFIVDQRFWGERVRALGAGPAPLPVKGLTAEKLAAAMSAIAADPGLRRRAQRAGEAIRAEHGLREAVHLVKKYLEA